MRQPMMGTLLYFSAARVAQDLQHKINGEFNAFIQAINVARESHVSLCAARRSRSITPRKYAKKDK